MSTSQPPRAAAARARQPTVANTVLSQPRVWSLAALVLLLAIPQCSGQGITVVLFDASANAGQDPRDRVATLTSAWSVQPATGAASGTGVDSVGPGNCPAWLIDDAPDGSEQLYYSVGLSTEHRALVPNGFALHVRMRFAKPAPTVGAPHGQTVVFDINGLEYWLAFSRCADGLLQVILSYASAQSVTLCHDDSDGADFVYYYIRHMSGSPTAELYLNGQLATAFEPKSGTGNRLRWGDWGSAEDSAYWNLVKLEVCEEPACDLSVPAAIGDDCPIQSPHALTTGVPVWPAPHPVPPAPTPAAVAVAGLGGAQSWVRFGVDEASLAFIALNNTPGVMHVYPNLYVQGVDILATLSAMNEGAPLPGRGSFNPATLPAEPTMWLDETGSTLRLGATAIFHAFHGGVPAVAVDKCVRVAGYDLQELIVAAGAVTVPAAGAPAPGTVLFDVNGEGSDSSFGLGTDAIDTLVVVTNDAAADCLAIENILRVVTLVVDGVDVLGFLRGFFAPA